MARTLTLAAIQFSPSDDVQDNITRVAGFIREAAAKGADVVLPPELFCGHYFCKTQEEEHFARAEEWTDHQAVLQLSELAAELGVVIPVSIYEKDGPLYFNSVVMIDADGTPLGVYRKSHIPDGPGYQEKYYFRPGDTGFRTWSTLKGRIGVGICWDQWFPEAARAMALMGADALLYPTAIGAEPQDAGLDTAARWRRGMQGHAVANVIPVVAANRFGDEQGQVFYGTSFITDETGEIVTELGRKEEGILVATFDLDHIDRARAAWGFFRDRRTDLYDILL
jgi:N-carbamoylputrescine amidase